MADDKTKIGKPERDLVSISEDYEVRDLTAISTSLRLRRNDSRFIPLGRA
jgi:hypothetical protein